MGKHKGLALKHLETVFTAGAVGSLPDGLLLERFLAGRGNAESSSAFAALVERHGPMVLGVCHDVLRHYQDAEDAAQATFLILAKQGRSIRRVESLASWLYGVALRVSARAKVEAARRRVVERRGAEMNAQMQSSEREELSAALHEELSRLPEKYRSPIVLCHLEGLSNEHAALQLGVPVRSIQRRLAQGRERLRLRLIRRAAEPAIGLLAARAATQDAPEAWVNSTVRVGCGLAAGQELGAVASASVAILAEGVLSMIYIGRIKFVAAAIVAAVAVITACVGIGGGITESRQIASPPVPNNASDATASRGKAADPPSVRIGEWLKGVVVDASGAPVGGARVSSFWTLDPEVVTTKADGTFAIPNKEPRLSNVSILATADGGALQGIFRFDDPATGPKDAHTLPRIVLKPARSVTVTVVDGQKDTQCVTQP